MALTKISTDGFKDDAVTTDKLANAINTERTANTAKDLTALSASNLTSGTIPDARFPATLPAVSGASLTNLPAGGKATNLVINGAMNVAQRATSSTSGGYRTLDRYKAEGGANGVTTTQSQQDLSSSDTPYSLGFRKYFRIALSGAGTANSNAYAEIQQRIEAQNIATSGWNYTSSSSYITLQFWFRASTNQTFYAYLYSFDGTKQVYTFSFTASGNNTWTKITKTIPGNSNLTFDNNNGPGMQIKFMPYYGTDYSNNKTLDQWGAYDGANQLPDMASTWLTAGASTFDLTGLQLEVGDTASDFASESYQDTLLKCYRYYYAHKGPLQGHVSAGDHLDVAIFFPVPMRTSPSRTQVDTSLEFKNRLNQGNSVSANTYNISGASNEYGAQWISRPASGESWDTSDGRIYYYHIPEGTTSFAWSAEL